MGLYEINAAVISRTLEDAGCDGDTIQKFLQLRAAGRREEAVRLLACHRCHLMNAIHEAQRPVDILDYFINQMKKDWKE